MRFRESFNNLAKIVDLFSENEQEFDRYIEGFMKCHNNYMAMVNGGDLKLNDLFGNVSRVVNDVPVEVSEESIEKGNTSLEIMISAERVKKHILAVCGDKLIEIQPFIDTHYKQYDEFVSALIDLMKKEGEIMEPRAGFIKAVK